MPCAPLHSLKGPVCTSVIQNKPDRTETKAVVKQTVSHRKQQSWDLLHLVVWRPSELEKDIGESSGHGEGLFPSSGQWVFFSLSLLPTGWFWRTSSGLLCGTFQLILLT